MYTLQDYEVISTIGCGSFGECKQIKRKCDNKVLVWKEIDYSLMTNLERKMLTTEVNLLRKIKHPYIVSYYGHILDKTEKTLYIIMEYCAGGDLCVYVKKCRKQQTPMDEDYIWKILCQLTLALRECHSGKRTGQKILHRDIKPANIFLTSDKDVKLGDFGFARSLSYQSEFATTFAGTPYYMSPELLNNYEYNEKTDVWSLGCLIYELCALAPPFVASSMTSLKKMINEGKCQRIPEQYSEELNVIVMKMLTVSADKRPNIEKIIQMPILAEKYPRYYLEFQSLLSHDGNVRDKVLAIENRVSDDSLRKKMDELLAKEKELDVREQILKEREAQLEKNLAIQKQKEKLNEKRLRRQSSRL